MQGSEEQEEDTAQRMRTLGRRMEGMRCAACLGGVPFLGSADTTVVLLLGIVAIFVLHLHSISSLVRVVSDFGVDAAPRRWCRRAIGRRIANQ